jgi:hypothetical protein
MPSCGLYKSVSCVAVAAASRVASVAFALARHQSVRLLIQSDAEYGLLDESQKFRHVRCEPNDGIEFTWEREWCVHAEELELDPNATTLIVPTRAWEKWSQDGHIALLSRRAILTMGFNGPGSVAEFPWHFIVLEDLRAVPDQTYGVHLRFHRWAVASRSHLPYIRVKTALEAV